MATATAEPCPTKFGQGRRNRQDVQLNLTPSASYIYHWWIKSILRNTSNGWAELNLAAFSRRPGSPCLRSCREAYNRLYAVQDQLGLTFVHNHDKVPKIYVCLTKWLESNPDSDRLPLFFKQDGRKRHLRARHESPDLPLSVNAQLYIERRRPDPLLKNHGADPALTLYTSLSETQTEKAFQSSPKKNSGFATNNKVVCVDRKLAGWILSRCREGIPGSYRPLWSPRATKMVFGYVKKALGAAHDKDDIIACFVESAEALNRQHISGFDAGLIAIKATEILKTYTSRGSTPEARLATFALRKKAENISASQADADEILRHLSLFQKTKLVDLTILSFLTLSVFKDPPAKMYLFQRLSRHGRKYLYAVHCRIQRDLFYRSRFRQESFQFTKAA